MSMPTTSIARPVVARYQMMMFASVPCIASGSGSPGCSRRHDRMLAMITPPQIHDPTTSSVAPM